MIKELENIVKEVFKKLEYDENYARISYSKLPESCDYQINSVFYLSSTLKENPTLIGNKIVEELSKYKEIFSSVLFCNPGFINLKLSEKFINKYVNKVLIKEKLIDGDMYYLDYGGPNIAKSLHVGHLRPAIIGESIKRTLKYCGANVVSDAHFGDFGLQIGEVIYGLKKENIGPNEITIGDLERIYPSISKLCKEKEDILKECQNITKDLQFDLDEYKEYWQHICEISLNDIKRLYKYLDVSFDLWNSESDAFEYILPMIKYLESKNIIKEDDGAKIIEVKKSTDEKEMPPLILQKSDGAYLYSTTDLACIYERILKYNPNYILYVVDERQKLHFEQVFRVCNISKMSDNCVLEHNYFGTINGLDGKPLKTRNGDLLKLDELINDTKNIFLSKKTENKSMSEDDVNIIVNAIIKYADLQNNREKSYIFDINKFSDTVGKTGPYILYTALRIRKILNDFDYKINEIDNKSTNEEERKLKLKLIEKNEILKKSVSERMPHYIADYIYELSSLVNSFYQSNNILNEKNLEVKSNWLNLLNICYITLKNLLYLLGIQLPSKM